jgi:hypothetical protein
MSKRLKVVFDGLRGGEKINAFTADVIAQAIRAGDLFLVHIESPDSLERLAALQHKAEEVKVGTLLLPEDVAAMLGLPARRLKNPEWQAEMGLFPVRIGKDLRFRRSDVERFIKDLPSEKPAEAKDAGEVKKRGGEEQ